jgi:hypothetical protein
MGPIPGFTAAASLYQTGNQYHPVGPGSPRTLADVSRLVSPQLVWPPSYCWPPCGPKGGVQQCCRLTSLGRICWTSVCPIDPCAHFHGCARLQCNCEEAGGIPMPAPNPPFPCGFACT